MRAFVVKFCDLPRNDWSVTGLRDNRSIPKYCTTCGNIVDVIEVFEKGESEDEIHCANCLREKKDGKKA